MVVIFVLSWLFKCYSLIDSSRSFGPWKVFFFFKNLLESPDQEEFKEKIETASGAKVTGKEYLDIAINFSRMLEMESLKLIKYIIIYENTKSKGNI